MSIIETNLLSTDTNFIWYCLKFLSKDDWNFYELQLLAKKLPKIATTVKWIYWKLQLIFKTANYWNYHKLKLPLTFKVWIGGSLLIKIPICLPIVIVSIFNNF